MEQTVANEGETQSQTETKPEGAPDELDQLLAEYDGAKETKTEEPDLKSTVTELASFVRETRNDRLQNDINAAVKAVKGDAPVDDDVVRAMLEVKAQKDSRFKSAWDNRKSNPEGWERVSKAFGREMEAKFEGLKIDKSATEDRAAIAASVKGATKTQESEQLSPEEAARWSPAEYQEWKRKHGHVSY